MEVENSDVTTMQEQRQERKALKGYVVNGNGIRNWLMIQSTPMRVFYHTAMQMLGLWRVRLAVIKGLFYPR